MVYSADPGTEGIVQGIIDRYLCSHTILSVMHRLDHINRYDKVALFEAGEVVEFDDPAVLLAQPSRFAELYASRQEWRVN
jgi:ABC-type multidrug transport system fused ATPase/permease subunit